MATAALLTTSASIWSGWAMNRLTPRIVLALAFLGIICSGWSIILWYQALQSHGAALVGASLYLEPLFTVAAANALLGEPLSS